MLKLTNAYAVLANQGREVRPTIIDYVQDRNGKVIYRTDNRCQVMEGCNAAEWDGRSMPRPPLRTKQLLDPQAAYQMVHIMEGVVERGTATTLREPSAPIRCRVVRRADAPLRTRTAMPRDPMATS